MTLDHTVYISYGIHIKSYELGLEDIEDRMEEADPSGDIDLLSIGTLGQNESLFLVIQSESRIIGHGKWSRFPEEPTGEQKLAWDSALIDAARVLELTEYDEPGYIVAYDVT